MSDDRVRQMYLDHTSATEEQVARAQAIASRTGESVGAVLEMMGAITAKERVRCLAIQMGIRFVDLVETPPPAALLHLIPPDIQRKYKAVPVSIRITLAMANPLGAFSVDEIEEATGHAIEPALASEDDVNSVLAGLSASTAPSGEAGEEHEDEAATPLVSPELSEPSTDETPISAALSEEAEETAAEDEDSGEPFVPADDLPTDVRHFLDSLAAEVPLPKGRTTLAIQRCWETGDHVGRILVDLGVITEGERVRAQGRQWGIEFIDLSEFVPDPSVVDLLPRERLHRYAVLPLSLDRGVLRLAMANPIDVNVVDSIQVSTGHKVEALIAIEADIRRILAQFPA